MISLRPMQASEFSDYVSYFVPDYAAEISANYDVDLGTATARAEREVAADLGQGVDTPGQVLLCIVDDALSTLPIGYLWCKPDAAGETVFISDFYLAPEHRGKGHAKAALALLEAMFSRSSYRALRLRVAADNARARQVYEAAGYRVTGFNMQKPLPRR